MGIILRVKSLAANETAQCAPKMRTATQAVQLRVAHGWAALLSFIFTPNVYFSNAELVKVLRTVRALYRISLRCCALVDRIRAVTVLCSGTTCNAMSAASQLTGDTHLFLAAVLWHEWAHGLRVGGYSGLCAAYRCTTPTQKTRTTPM